MSHVDEGALHAYLDGALDEYPVAEATRIREHLDQCGECAERLEVERSVRSDAHAVLALAAPDVDLPSLEELRAYVKRTRPQRSTASTRMVRMGWAASVALALGTGYILRDGQLALQSPGMDVAAPTTEALGSSFEASTNAPARDAVEEVAQENDSNQPASPAEAAGARAVGVDGAGPASAEGARTQGLVAERETLVAPGGASTDVLSGGGAGRLERAAPSEVAVTRLANEAPVVPPPAPSTDAAPVAVTADDAARDVVASAAALDEVVAEQTGAESDLLSPADLADSLRQGATGLPANALADADQMVGAASSADVTGSDSGAVAAEPAAEPAVAEDRERRRSDSPVAVSSALERSGEGAFAAKAEEGELETLPATAVPGLELIEVSGIGEGTIFLGTHTTQRFEDGGMLNVFHLEPGVAPDVLPERSAGENEVTYESEEGLIVVRGPRSRVELQELLERLLPEG